MRYILFNSLDLVEKIFTYTRIVIKMKPYYIGRQLFNLFTLTLNLDAVFVNLNAPDLPDENTNS